MTDQADQADEPRDRWYAVALPLLEHIAGLSTGAPYRIADLAAAIGCDDVALVNDQLEMLYRSGYLNGEVHRTANGGRIGEWSIWHLGLGERGARVTGMWPPEDAYQALLDRLELQMMTASPEDRSKWAKARDRIVQMGQDLGVQVAAAVLADVARRG